MVLIVSPLRLLPEVIAARAPSHMITLLAAEELIETPAGFALERHLRLGCHDIAIPMDGLIAPDAAMVERGAGLRPRLGRGAPMVIHCWAGISRSTASAFAIACERNPRRRRAGDRARHAPSLALRPSRTAASSPWPTTSSVVEGRMVEAVEAMGGNGFVAEGVPFDLAGRGAAWRPTSSSDCRRW